MAPGEFLVLAKTLASDAGASDAQIRRSVSTAYYALFHTALEAAADAFMGRSASNRPGYALIYRGFDHRRMRTVCDEIDRSVLKTKYRQAVGADAVHRDLREFVNIFVALQQLRHAADYDPTVQITQVDAVETAAEAERGIQALGRAPDEARRDLLALLLTDARAW